MMEYHDDNDINDDDNGNVDDESNNIQQMQRV